MNTMINIHDLHKDIFVEVNRAVSKIVGFVSFMLISPCFVHSIFHLREPLPSVHHLVKDFQEAHAVASKLYFEGVVETIWVMGGQQVFSVSHLRSL